MLKNYLKLTLQLLKKKKLFTVIIILGMTLPMMFLMITVSSVSHFTRNGSPQSNFDKVILLKTLRYSIERKNSMSGNMISGPTFHFVQNYVKQMHSPEKVGVISGFEYFNHYANNKKVKLTTVYTDDSFWEIADFAFIEGKPFIKSDMENSQLVAVIDEYTKNIVFGEGDAVGKTMRIFKKQYKIAGVVNNVDRTHQHTYSNIWLPITTSEKYLVNDIYGSGVTCLLMAKSKEGISRINDEFLRIVDQFDLGSYEGLTNISGELIQESFNQKLQNILRDLFSLNLKENYILYLAYAVIFFFFILLPSINLLYIHSSRINERSSEIGVRKSFGGARQVISKQFIVENITIAVISGISGLFLTLIFFQVLNSSQVIRGLHMSINIQSLLVCVLLWLVFGVITGLIPAIRMSYVKIIDALNRREINKNINVFTKRVKRMRLILVVEFILAFISLAVILSFVFRFKKLNEYPLGFDYKDVYQVSVKQYDKQASGWFGAETGNKEISELIKSHQFVDFFGKWEFNEPYHKGYTTVNDGIKYKENHLKDNVYLTITGEYMDKILDLNIIEGRWFNEEDKIPDYYPVVLNESCKRKLFGNENAVGKTVEIRGTECQVIGVVDYYKYHGEYSRPVDIVFSKILRELSISSWGKEKTDFFRVKKGTPLESVNSMARELSQKYPDYEINITPLEVERGKHIRESLGPIVVVIIVFSFIFFIVLLGLFGVLLYDLNLRRQEIGVRRATGATSSNIFLMVLKEMLVWATVGILIGTVFFAQIPILNLLTFSFDEYALAFIFASFIIYILVSVCCLIPANQASKIQPAVALHEN